MKKRSILNKLVIVGAIIIFASCNKETSPTTGWEYNNTKNGGFEVVPYDEQETGPGLVLIEGGTYIMGRTEQDVLYDWNNIPRRVTVSSFYIDETEVRNLDYLEYLFWLKRVFGTDFIEIYKKALPDTLVWRDKLAYNEPYVQLYLRHPAYRDYPVVGVNWLQATDYCKWRTDRVNEYILIREGILKVNPDQTNANNFVTESYLAGLDNGDLVKNDLIDISPSGQGTRKVKMEDGIFLPEYRLPTEAEWEYASLGLIGNTLYERVIERRLYPWNGHVMRTDEDRNMGEFVSNFKRGRGDNMGVAGNLNDAADITAPVYAYWPNDYGLYNMSGNVSEWVMDIYRTLSPEDMTDFRPFRGNVYTTQDLDIDGNFQKSDTTGRLMWKPVSVGDNINRRNYRKSDNINYLDGDATSTVKTSLWEQTDVTDTSQMERDSTGALITNAVADENTTGEMYQYGAASMINDKARVYKGASWRDRAYWNVAGTRRYMDQKVSTDFIGFRCAMTRVGSPIGNY